MIRRHKYNAKQTTVNGIDFDSQAEAIRYTELVLLCAAGQITDLELQPVFELQPKFKRADGKTERAIKYVADFRYKEGGSDVVEEVKGFQTKVWNLKRKLFLYKFRNLELRVIK